MSSLDQASSSGKLQDDTSREADLLQPTTDKVMPNPKPISTSGSKMRNRSTTISVITNNGQHCSRRKDGGSSIQFDEEALLNSPSILAARRGNGGPSTASPRVSATIVGRDGRASLASPVSLAERRVGRRNNASESAFSTGAASFASSSGSKKTPRASVITVPAWARNEPPSPPDSPQLQAQARSSPQSVHGRRKEENSKAGGPSSAVQHATNSHRQRRSKHHDQLHPFAENSKRKARKQEDEEIPQQCASIPPAHYGDNDEYEDISDDEPAPENRLGGTSGATTTGTVAAAPQGRSEARRGYKTGFWNRRKLRRKMRKENDFRDGGDGFAGFVAANDAARRFGSANFLSEINMRQGIQGAASGSSSAILNATPSSEALRRDSSKPQQGNVYDEDDDGPGEDEEQGQGTADLPTIVMRTYLKAKDKDGEDLVFNQQDGRGRSTELAESWTRHQPLSPGWDSPWQPEMLSERQSIEVGRYRFHAGTDGYFPHTKTNKPLTSEKKNRKKKTGWAVMFDWAWHRDFLLHNPFVPLLLRFINIAFTAATLAVAIRVHIALLQEDAAGVVGSSPVVGIIFACPTLIHVAFQIWLEYFGRPVGLWSVRSKLLGTLIEIILVAFWSAELALAFDNYYTSPLVCSTYNSPFASGRQICIADPNSPTQQAESPLNDNSRKPHICRLQGALIGLCFVSLLAYTFALTLSLFRIFVRVSARSATRN
ncbi:hypothetical protein K437DRAFT_235602 [Tilletiaria anomala UBC 951]|uniref:Transmembrane protein n=1 Tax=Tilletiaria anomala (strain ATCC 24038 / CBS 436.72 / UBC 951) TaxID=1037660 RepID=A0A066W4C4_TILAU|nr:uncharacterized protein K437DRAFT_235602 [Tilletiaria anomala UBC 951]KDN45914.1 hypothetical protein K437DRAFT_235602 [Tilletiaria anomala UBC 951]